MSTVFITWVVGWVFLLAGLASTPTDPMLAIGGFLAGAVMIVGAEIASAIEAASKRK